MIAGIISGGNARRAERATAGSERSIATPVCPLLRAWNQTSVIWQSPISSPGTTQAAKRAPMETPVMEP